MKYTRREQLQIGTVAQIRYQGHETEIVKLTAPGFGQLFFLEMQFSLCQMHKPKS